MPFHNHDFDERDLSEAPRLAKDSQPRGLIVGGVVAAALFLGLLAYGSRPELSPEDIVSMEGYAGEQPTKYIFNIHSLDQQSSDDQMAAAPENMEQPRLEQSGLAESAEAEQEIAHQEMAKPEVEVELESPVVVTTSMQPEPVIPELVTREPVAPVLVTPEPSVATVETVQSQSTEVAVVLPILQPEIEVTENEVITSAQTSDPVVTTIATRIEPPASLFGTVQEERVVAAMATTPTIDEASDTVVVSSVAAIEPVPVPSGSLTAVPSSKGKLLPLRSVLEDFTELKASPTAQSKTILSLERGVVVTAFERRGKWIHIGTNDGSSITGYVLESSLGRVDTKNSG